MKPIMAIVRENLTLVMLTVGEFLLYWLLPLHPVSASASIYRNNYVVMMTLGSVGAMGLALEFLHRAWRRARNANSGVVVVFHMVAAAANALIGYVILYQAVQVLPQVSGWNKSVYLSGRDLWYFSAVTFFNIDSGCCAVTSPDHGLLTGIALVQALSGLMYLAALVAVAVAQCSAQGPITATTVTASPTAHQINSADNDAYDDDVVIPTGPPTSDLELYKIAVDTRKLELTLFWQRSTFFWGFLAAVLAGYVLANQQHWIRLILSHIGFVAGLCWWLANRGSKYWHENWEQMVTKLEDSPAGLFSRTGKLEDKGLLGAAGYSVSKITIFFSGCMTILFLGLSLYEVVRPFKDVIAPGVRIWVELTWPPVVSIMTMIAAVTVYREGRSGSINRTRVRPKRLRVSLTTLEHRND